MVFIMDMHSILQKKTSVVLKNKTKVALAALPLLILIGLGYISTPIAIASGLLVVFADLYFIYKMLNIIEPSPTYKTHFEKNKIELLLNYFGFQFILLMFTGIISFVTAATLVSTRDIGHTISPSPIQLGFVAITFLIIIIAILFLSQTPYLIAYAAFGRIDEEYISVFTAMRKSISLMRKHGLHFALFTIRILLWFLVPFGLLLIGAVISLSLGLIFYILVLILMAPFCMIVAINVYASKLFYFDELAKEEQLLITNS